MFFLITIDGGAASGKSTTARRLSELRNLLHADTGSYYRSLTLWLMQNGAFADGADLENLLSELNLGVNVQGRTARLTLNGVVPEPSLLRSEAVNANISTFAAMPQVRDKLRDYQRNQLDVASGAGLDGLVMEGRDIGSVIFPDAKHRFFLEADEATRTRRREAEGQQDAVGARDQADASRATAPLVCPEGAIRIDTSANSVEAVVTMILNVVDSQL